MSTHFAKPKRKPGQRPALNGRTKTVTAPEIVFNGSARIPALAVDHDTFRRWARSDAFPERGQFFFLNGILWADLSMETLIHNQIKQIFTIVIGAIVLNEAAGRYLGDRMMLTHEAAGLSCEPDGMFISNEAFDRGRVRLEEGDTSLEIIGTPDMTLEVISKTSVTKDMIVLKELYAKAGIPEYWLVDSTSEAPELVIMRLVNGKYAAARKSGGWVKSRVFGRSFRLTSTKDAAGLSQFNLETK